MIFELDSQQVSAIELWHKNLQKKLIAEEKAQTDPWGGIEGEDVYYGAIGGGLTYEFTPTSLGVVVKVRESISGEELDVTDYDSW